MFVRAATDSSVCSTKNKQARKLVQPLDQLVWALSSDLQVKILSFLLPYNIPALADSRIPKYDIKFSCFRVREVFLNTIATSIWCQDNAYVLHYAIKGRRGTAVNYQLVDQKFMYYEVRGLTFDVDCFQKDRQDCRTRLHKGCAHAQFWQTVCLQIFSTWCLS